MEEAEGRTGLCDTFSVFQDVFVGTEKSVYFLATKKFWKVSHCHCYELMIDERLTSVTEQ